MESYESLREKLWAKEEELRRISRKTTVTTPWAPGVTDQFNTHEATYTEYTNPEKAEQLKSEIEYLKEQMRTYGERKKQLENAELAREKAKQPDYQYEAAGITKTTKNEALAARYDAQQRYFGMNKLKRGLVRINGQYKKFEHLWLKAADPVSKEQEKQVADELNKMFK